MNNTDQPVVIPAAAASLGEVAALVQLTNRRRLQQTEDRRRMVSEVLRQASKG